MNKFSFKYFLNISLVREISPKKSHGFGSYEHERVKQVLIASKLISNVSSSLAVR